MNPHITLYSPSLASASYASRPYRLETTAFSKLEDRVLASKLDFKLITPLNMREVWEILQTEKGRTTDFSYGGILMWVDYFHYEYAVLDETLFIKGRVESDTSKVAFSMPVGKMSLSKSVSVLKEYCRANGIPLIFSAVPEYALPGFRMLSPERIEPLEDWADYLYAAETLATLKGKKYGKKRNHVNQFLAAFPGYTFEYLTPRNCRDAMVFMDTVDSEGDTTPMAVEERKLNRVMLDIAAEGDGNILGAILRDAGGNVLAFTIGDIKGDTLFIHVEKSSHSTPGGFETINKMFAEAMTRQYPGIKYINREDDAGDTGLRLAKESYHPIEKLAKYNIVM